MFRIGIDARFYGPKATGVGQHVLQLVQNLAQLDTENHYTVFLNAENYDDFIAPGPHFSAEKTCAKYYSFAEQTIFFMQIRRHHFDLMVVPQFNIPLLYRGQFVITIHDMTTHLFPGKKTSRLAFWVYTKVIENAVARAKHIFAASKYTKKDIIKFLQVPEEKISVVYNGVLPPSHNFSDTKKLSFCKKKYLLPKKYLLYIGVFRDHKNIRGLISAYHLLRKNHPDIKIDLVMCGPKDPVYTNELEKIISEKHLDHEIHWTGFFPEEDLELLIAGAHAFVFPSFYEGFGFPPLEAMRVQVPVACSNTSCLPEVYEEAALYFDPYDIPAMASALYTITTDEDIRKKLREKGNIQWKKYSWYEMTKKMLQTYQKILHS